MSYKYYSLALQTTLPALICKKDFQGLVSVAINKQILVLMTYFWSRPWYHSYILMGRLFSLSCGNAAIHPSQGLSLPTGATLQISLLLWVIRAARCDNTVPNMTCTCVFVPKFKAHHSPASSLQSNNAEEDFTSGLLGEVWLLQHEIRLQINFYWLTKSYTGTETHQPER